MPTTQRQTLTRRAFLAAAPFVPTVLLAGCGGDSRPEDALPEGYGEAYSLSANDGEQDTPQLNYAFWTTIAVSSAGDVILSQYKGVDDGVSLAGLGKSEFTLLRYTNEARPGATARSGIIPARRISADSNPLVIPTPDGQVYVPDWLLSSPDTPQLLNEYALLTADGVQVRRVVLTETRDTPEGEYTEYDARDLTVAPNGDFYGAARSFTRGSDILSSSKILRWSSDGAFAGSTMVGQTYSFLGSRVVFAANGEPFTLAYDETQKRRGIYFLQSGAFTPLATNGVGLNLQTDAAGNVYFLSSERAGRATNTRNQPTPRTVYIRKFSPTGAELAAIVAGNEYELTTFAVSGNGTIFLVNGVGLRVFRRTR